MMIKTNKILSVIILLIIISFSTISYGFGIDNLTGKQDDGSDVVGTETLKNTGDSFVKIASTIGVIISVITLIVLGIKYMMGSVDEKAEYKKSLLPYVIGAGLVFAASSIAQIIYDIAIQL